jgi:hypothetical protein
MANLSVSKAWSETTAFMTRESGLVLPIAFLLIALPGVALQLAMPTAADPASPPEAGLWLLLLPIVVIASIVGSIAITHLALRPGSSVAESLQVGLRRFLPLFVASLLIGLVAGLVFVVLAMLLVGGSLAEAEANPVAVMGPLLLVFALVFVLSMAIWIRLMLMTPIATAEALGPIGIIRRSWALTAGHFWKLLGLMILLIVVALVVMIAISAVFGIFVFLVAGAPEPGSVSQIVMAIVTALLQGVLSAVLVTLIARIYVQLAGTVSPEVFA